MAVTESEDINISSGLFIFSLVFSAFFLVRATRTNSSSTSVGKLNVSSQCKHRSPASADCIASLRYAGAAFGPPMVFCGIQDPYSQWQFPRLFLGGIVSFLTVLAFLVASIDRRMEKQKADTEDKKQGEVKQKE